MNTTILHRFPVIVSAVLLLSQPALAASSDVLEDNQAQDSVEAANTVGKSTGKWTLGIGTAYAPRYEGAKDSTVHPLPSFSYKHDRFTAGLSGLRYNFSSNYTVQLGPRISFRGGRREDVDDHLIGLGDIKAGIAVGGFFRWHLSGAWSLRADVNTGVGKAKGSEINLAVNHISVMSTADLLLLSASVNWADQKYMQQFFGIDATQSIRSGLPIYTAESGVKNITAHATWMHIFTPEWFAALRLQAKHLSGDAADSPITERKDSIGAIASVVYRF